MADLLHEGYRIGAIHNACASKRDGTGQNPIKGGFAPQLIELRPIGSVFEAEPRWDKAPFEQLIFH